MKLNLKIYLWAVTLVGLVASMAAAEEITTLDGKTYTDVKDVSLKPKGLFS